MNIFSNLRLLVFLRRIALNLERVALAVERLADTREREWAESHPIPRSAIKGKPATELHTFDVKEAERRWAQRRAEMMQDQDNE